jgi:hypothetical protein
MHKECKTAFMIVGLCAAPQLSSSSSEDDDDGLV